MQKTPLALLVATLLIAGPAFGQNLLKLKKTFEIPKGIAAADADHATMAISDRGDILVAWQVDVPFLSGTYVVKRVEAAFFERSGSRGWIKPDGNDVMILGDPALGLLAAEAETCRKPDVTAIGEDFIVTWPRNVPTGAPGEGEGQLEVVRIRRNPVFGGTFVDAPQSGAGYIVDPFFDAGDGGPMQDNVALTQTGPGIAATFYVHQEFLGFTTREFDLRQAVIDFSQDPPIITGPSVLIDNLPMDDGPLSGPPNGGLVLPDAVEDDFGHIVLGYEEYVEAGHQGAPQTQGWVRAKRYEYAGAGVFNELDSWEYSHPTQAEARMRRPNLSQSNRDSENTVQISWMSNEDDPSAIAETIHYELDFTGGVGAGLVLETDMAFPLKPGVADTLPVPVQGANLKLDFAIRSGSPNRIVAWVPTRFTEIRTIASPQTAIPDRPHSDMWELQPYGAPGNRVIPIVYEGPPLGGNGFRAIFIVVYRA